MEYAGEYMREYTEDQADLIAQYLLEQIVPSPERATILALQGDLGAGKTTLTKALAKQLGIQETVISPTFVIAKFYRPFDYAQGKSPFSQLVHIDAYRIESLDELGPLDWQKIIQQPNTLIVIEWPERIAAMIPSDAQQFVITHEGDRRKIEKI
jgi:tRNA threonylcarbamoyladenosine biosynthesis protein TsaE